MSVTRVHDWRFRPDGDVEEGIAAMREYVSYLRERPGCLHSLWLRSREDPLRFFHVAVFADDAAMLETSASGETERFVERLYPEIDESTHTAPECDVILSSRDGFGAGPA